MSALKQAFKGLINIVSSTNDTLFWKETNGGSFTLNTPLTLTGENYPTEILADLVAEMTTKSAASGGTITYTGAIDNDTGITTITASVGTFAFDLTSAQTQKFLTGADGATGSLGEDHFGFMVDAAVPSEAATHVGDNAHSNAWYPTAPDSGPTLSTDDLGNLSSLAVNSVSLGGKTLTYDFGDSTRDQRYQEVRALSFRFLSAASRTQFEDQFWLVYAKQGAPSGRFRYFPDRSDTGTYIQYHLTGDILNAANFTRSTPSISRWDIAFSMKRYKA